MRHSIKILATGALLGGAMALAGAAEAATGKDFYNGKTVRWIISTGPGGGHDFYARLFARHMERKLPGSKFVTLNRPGAGHRIGANLIYTAKPNGLTIGNFTTGLIYGQIMNLKGIKFDLAKMSWIGKGASDVRVVSAAVKGDYKTWDDVMNTKRKIKWSASGVGSGAWNDAFLISEAFKIPYRIIPGYQGTESALGMVRGETDLLVGGASSGMNYVRGGHTRIILRFGHSPQYAELFKTVPDAIDLAKTEQQKRLGKMLTLYGQLSRIIAGPPNIVPDRLKALRTAFMEAANDPLLIEEGKRSHRLIEAANGEETTKLVIDMLNQPPEIVAMLTALTKVKVPMIKTSGKVTATKRGGRRITIGDQNEKYTAKVSGSRTTVMLNGKKVKRKAIKVGMICTFTWPKINSEAKTIDCKG
ncbi:MAG: tripartite tricarboxylate transporter substrate-binding protein [Alphaproteobacteria bacterium]|nr:tripartite tricarboxylate transporter substrate-binding protein [Alphaproteobacteria bacterium]